MGEERFIFVESHTEHDLLCALEVGEEDVANLRWVVPYAEEFPVRTCDQRGSIRVDEPFIASIDENGVRTEHDGMTLGRLLEPAEAFAKLCDMTTDLCRAPVSMLVAAGLEAGFPHRLALDAGHERNSLAANRLLRNAIRGNVWKDNGNWVYHNDRIHWKIQAGGWLPALEALHQRRLNHQEY